MRITGKCNFWSYAVLSLFLLLSAPLVQAAQSADTTLNSTSIQKIIDEAAAKGLNVIIVSGAGTQINNAAADETGESTQAAVGHFRDRLKLLLHFLPEVLPSLSSGFNDVNTDIGGSGLFWTLLIIILSMGAAAFVENRYLNWVIQKLASLWASLPSERSINMCFLLVRYIGRTVGIGIFCLVSFAISSSILSDNKFEQATIFQWINAVAWAWLITEIWRIWISPKMPDRRIPDLNDDDAITLFNWLRAGTIFGICMIEAGTWLEKLEFHDTLILLLRILITVGILAITLILLSKARQPISALILKPEDRPNAPLLQRIVAANWHHAVGLYVLVAGIVSIYRLIMGLPNALGLIGAMYMVLMVSLTAFGIGTVMIDRLLERRKILHHPNIDPQPETVLTHSGEHEEAEEANAEPQLEIIVRDLTYVGLARQALLLMIFGGAGVFMLARWGVDFTSPDSALGRLWEVFFVIVTGYVCFQVAKIAFGQKMMEEGGEGENEPGEEGGHGGASRLATLLPLMRYCILATIVVLTIMIALSELGLNIGPLFAGAGVIGMAIGFGAQTLIRDIFSGAFFLVDDAFRKGEYVDVGSVKGTVEKISIRSLQLRHHMGPLNTVPFGEIKTLSNFSRDWVMMKLKLRLTYDTDVEKVRKLIKNLGKELLEHPEFGDQFLQPLKSQGVYAMEDSAMIIRVKFMTRPGDQFVIRKHVYSRIRELFAQKGIQFANRLVTVRLAEDENSAALTQNQKTQILGAALPEIDGTKGS